MRRSLCSGAALWRGMSTSAASEVPSRSVLVFGSSGALGLELCAAFKRSGGISVTGVDLVATPGVDVMIQLIPGEDGNNPEAHRRQLMQHLTAMSSGPFVKPFDAILCVAGGWAGGNASDEALITNTEAMISSSLYPSLLSAHLAASGFLKEGEETILLIPGAAPLLGSETGTAFMIPYGVAKAAVHQLLQSLTDRETAGLPPSCTVCGIAPVTLDTPMNRTNMPNANFDKWTKLEDLANTITEWCTATSPEQRPIHGHMYEISGSEVK